MTVLSNNRTNPFDSSVSWRVMDTEILTVAEFAELPGVYGFRLQDRPRQGYIEIWENPTGGVQFTIVTSAPNAGQCRIDYESGIVTFNVADNGTECAVDYQGGGSCASIENVESIVNTATSYAVPVGTILFLAPGYFGAAGNGGGWTSIPTNTVAGLKTWMTSNGYDTFFQVCDGLALNDPDSPIFNGAGRYLPDLTDSRFLRGSTTAGGAAASSGTASAANESAHTHTGGSHTHTMANHTHTGGSHSHTLSSAGYGKLEANATGVYTRRVTGVSSYNMTHKYTATGQGSAVDTSASTTALELGGSTDSGGAVATLGPSTNTSDAGGTVATTAGSAHTHTITVSTVEPKYLAGFYIMRVK